MDNNQSNDNNNEEIKDISEFLIWVNDNPRKKIIDFYMKKIEEMGETNNNYNFINDPAIEKEAIAKKK